jgi:hypothetical protein
MPASIPTISLPKNQYTDRIDTLTSILNNASANIFCQNRYKDINYYIDDYHKQHFFSKNDNDNNQWKEILSKNLYSAYALKFVQQTMYVFNSSEWKVEDLDIIRSEEKLLRSSAYLQVSSEVAKKFRDINSVLAKYDEINSFISICNNFSYPLDDIKDQYPNVSDKIQKSRAYIRNNLENENVNNCIRLKNGLGEIPKKLFDEHANYLQKKIEKNVGKYREYATQRDYDDQFYRPLKNQIDALSNDVYGVSESTFNITIKNLKTLLKNENTEAFNFFDK